MHIHGWCWKGGNQKENVSSNNSYVPIKYSRFSYIFWKFKKNCFPNFPTSKDVQCLFQPPTRRTGQTGLSIKVPAKSLQRRFAAHPTVRANPTKPNVRSCTAIVFYLEYIATPLEFSRHSKFDCRI